MSSIAIDTIIFDLGGVLIDWNPRYVFKTIFSDEKEMDYFLNNICTSDWNEQQDGGRTIQEGTDLLVSQYPDYEEAIRAFYGRWEEMLGGEIQETLKILQDLRAVGTYQLFALTNWSAETFPIAIERYEFLQWFEDILVSGVEKMKKPDPKIYQLALKRFNINASQALFIDDNARNVIAAEKEGISSIHFTSPTDLRSTLVERGILG